MINKFQKHILEEINEIGEYAFILLIPYFLEIEKGIKIRNNGKGIGGYSENYNTTDLDFQILKAQIKELLIKFKLGIYKYLSGINSNKLEDCFELLDKEKSNEMINNKENWIYKQGMKGYFLREKEGSNKIEEYLHGPENNKN